MNECYNIVVVVKVATAVRGGESRTAISDRALVLGGGGLEKPNRGRDRGETFFPDSGSDRDSDETFQISRNLGLELDDYVCLLDSQPWLQRLQPPRLPSLSHNTEIDPPVLDPWSVEWDLVGATFFILLASWSMVKGHSP